MTYRADLLRIVQTVVAPSADIACGKDDYNSGTTCVNDLCRRVVTTVVRVATLI